MDIRLTSTDEAELQAFVDVLAKSFTIAFDSGTYKGSNPRYSSKNRLRKLVVFPKFDGATQSFTTFNDLLPQPRPGDVVLPPNDIT